jgi:phospholipid/cholesterol/gamma-HCH transport system ATP-binding protein
VELRAERLSIRLGETWALREVSVRLGSGARALVLGAPGAGKTTLLKALAGLRAPTAGAVRWDGAEVSRLPAPERRQLQAYFGMVFQTDALFDSATVLHNAALPLLNRGVPLKDARRRAERVLDELGLLGAAALSPAELSGGMRKRTGLARALVAEPGILLADDPLAGLDPGTAAQVAELLLRVSSGRTLLVALPDPTPLLPLPRSILLREGAVAYDGPTEPLASPPP